MDARAQSRYEAEKAEYEAKLKEREEKAKNQKRKPGGKPPKAPEAGARATDQYNFTDPDSRIMKNSTNQGFEQHYNAQAAVTQDSRFIVARSLSNHPNDKQEAEPTLAALSDEVGHAKNVIFDNGYYSARNIEAAEQLGLDPYIATGREAHYLRVDDLLGKLPDAPPADASPREKMAYKLATKIGQEIYRLRKSTVEPVFGIIKEILGFRQFSLRGLKNVAGEWCLVCLAYNLKNMHSLWLANELY